MENIVLQTKNITKVYGNHNALDTVSMTVRKGDIYGLIGKNGAGKTTLIRAVTSLVHASEGTIELFGDSSSDGLTDARKRIGCVVENPALYPNLTAIQNLKYYCKLRGIVDEKIIDETLKIVGLSDTGKKKYKNFSLGMRQRLGLALALLLKFRTSKRVDS